MSKSAKDLSKLRKKLEQPSKKTRHSTDLRRSLGRKSVGDVSASELAAFEQASSSTSNSSCHLNPDSAIIDTEFAENPEWYKHLVHQDVLASEESIHLARQREKELKISNDSNVDNLDLSSFNPRDINRILNSSVVIDKSTVERYVKRNEHNPRVSESPVAEDLTLELPCRKPTTLKRGHIKTRQRPINEFSRVLDATSGSESDTEAPSKVQKKHSLGRTKISTGHTNHPSMRPPGVPVPKDISFELPKRKPTTLKKGLRKSRHLSPGAYNEFDQVLEDTAGSEQEEQTSRTSKRLSSRGSAEINDSKSDSKTHDGKAQEASFEIPRRKPTTLRGGLRKSRHPSPNAFSEFDEVLEDTVWSEDGADTSGKKEKTLAVTNNSTNGKVSVAGNPEALSRQPVLKDSSFELPQRKPSTLMRGARKNRVASHIAVNEFDQVLEDTLGSEEDSGSTNQSSQKVLPSTVKSPARMVLNQVQNAPEPSTGKDVSFELPQRKPTSLQRGLKKPRQRPLDGSNEFDKVLEETLGSEEESSIDISGKNLSAAVRRGETAPLDRSDHNSPKKKRVSILSTKENVSSNQKEMIEHEQITVSKPSEELHCTLEDAADLDPANSTLPLGAEANNMSGLCEEIVTRKKQKLSLNKVNHAPALSQIQEEDTTCGAFTIQQAERHAVLNDNSRLKPPGFGDISKISSNLSITDNTRSAPLRISNIVRQELIANVPLSSSVDERGNVSKLSSVMGKSTSKLNQSLLKGSVSASALPESLDLEQVEVDLTSSSGVASPKSGALIVRSAPSSSSSKESLPPHQIRKSFHESERREVPQNSISEENLLQEVEPGEESDFSNASTVTLPSNLTVPISPITCTEIGSESTLSKERKSTVCSKSSGLVTEGSDSVFLKSAPLVVGRDLLGHQSGSNVSSSSLPPSNVPGIPHNQDETWTENPYPDRSHDSNFNGATSFAAESELFEELPSDIEAIDDNNVEDEGAGQSSNKGSVPSNNSRESSQSNTASKSSRESSQSTTASQSLREFSQSRAVHENLETVSSAPSSSDVLIEPIQMGLAINHSRHHSIFSPVAGNLGTQTKSSDTRTQQKQGSMGLGALSKKKTALTEAELEKMRCGMKKWMEDIRQNKHVAVEAEAQPKVQLQTNAFKKPAKPAPKAAKKKEPCPFFGDYRPPKRVKPRPYVTPKMYKFLEAKLKPKYGLETRIKAEEFVSLMCQLVETTIKKKSRYHDKVFQLRDEMVSLGIIKTQFDYHLFIEDYLPDSFRVKSIPCYGNPKGPTLDSTDLHRDLSAD